MELSRSNSDLMNSSMRQELLAVFGITPETFIAKGTEAEVYQYSDNEVVKIYPGSEHIVHLQTLQRFYEAIDESQCGFEIPRILRIEIVQSGAAVLERRIKGVTLESLIDNLAGHDLNQAEDLYLQAANNLSFIRMIKIPETYLLFDKSRRSYLQEQTWASFYSSLLRQKIDKVGSIFERVHPSFLSKAQILINSIEQEVSTQVSVVHGDFFPGNVLVSSDLSSVTGIIDFGSFTMFGNHLIDMASAFSFYRMYESNRAEIRKRMLPRVMSFINSHDQPSFFRYLLSHAILTSDLYVSEPDPLDNGHFQWAAEIIRDEQYWEQALSS